MQGGQVTIFDGILVVSESHSLVRREWRHGKKAEAGGERTVGAMLLVFHQPVCVVSGLLVCHIACSRDSVAMRIA